jgi:hypothetical protein
VANPKSQSRSEEATAPWSRWRSAFFPGLHPGLRRTRLAGPGGQSHPGRKAWGWARRAADYGEDGEWRFRAKRQPFRGECVVQGEPPSLCFGLGDGGDGMNPVLTPRGYRARRPRRARALQAGFGRLPEGTWLGRLRAVGGVRQILSPPSGLGYSWCCFPRVALRFTRGNTTKSPLQGLGGFFWAFRRFRSLRFFRGWRLQGAHRSAPSLAALGDCPTEGRWLRGLVEGGSAANPKSQSRSEEATAPWSRWRSAFFPGLHPGLRGTCLAGPRPWKTTSHGFTLGFAERAL